jgi:hypothetical protein
LTAFSQGLKPESYRINGEDRHCWSTEQAMMLASGLVQNQYKDTIISGLITVKDSLIYQCKTKDLIIHQDEKLMNEYKLENSLRNEETVACQKMMKLQIKSEKTAKTKNVVVGGTVGAIVGFIAGVIFASLHF